MVTMVGREGTLAKLLQDLIELDYDAIEAYDEAIKRLETSEYKQKLRQFKSDHERHTLNLAEHLRDMGEDVPSGPDVKRFLTKGKVILADMMGDTAILKAMKTNEDDTNTAYERAVKHSEVTPAVRKTLQANLLDERSHRAWLESIIGGRKAA